ncbi:MAG: hypothetical protein Q8P56_02425 [Candidatus Uhrbacteria bacterium]|nr:hypothetical protein [Candidatus Uhrbacteria bacterium]
MELHSRNEISPFAPETASRLRKAWGYAETSALEIYPKKTTLLVNKYDTTSILYGSSPTFSGIKPF